jgi:hypothetical protein
MSEWKEGALLSRIAKHQTTLEEDGGKNGSNPQHESALASNLSAAAILLYLRF